MLAYFWGATCVLGLALMIVAAFARARPTVIRVKPSPQAISGADVIAALRAREGRAPSGRLYLPTPTTGVPADEEAHHEAVEDRA